MRSYSKLRKSPQNKYKSTALRIEGIFFRSKKEGKRYQELRLLERAGEIMDLTPQPRFALLSSSDAFICNYVGDFSYIEKGKQIVEEIKGHETPVFKIKWKWVQADYGHLYEFRLIK